MGKCDTLDYWHIYYNDDVIAKFNSVSEDLIVVIKKENIKLNDAITLRCGDDTPCVNCTFHTIVRDQNRKELDKTNTNVFWGKMSFNLTDLINKEPGNKQFNFYYKEEYENGIQTEYRLKFKLVLE